MRNQSKTRKPSTSGTTATNPMETIMKTRHHFRSLGTLAIVCLASFLLVTTNAVGAPFATISILDTATGFNNTYQSTSISFSFSGLDLTAGDKLVVSIGAQSTGAGTVAGERVWSSVTFDSQAMTEAARIGANADNQYQSGIYYLDDLAGLSATGNLTITAATLNVRGASATAWVLSGTTDGHGAGAGSLGAGTSLTTTSDVDSWVLAHATVAGTTAPTAQSPLTAGLTVVNPYNGSAQTGNGTGYQTVLAQSGGVSLTPTFDIGATTVAAEFLAMEVPEPSTLILAGLGLAGLTLRRRRK
ncbi:MAG: PEP-CTERM sorting domain-containing protein [Lentisphaeria bacterium]|nr:PEP-CTERM sorting domain-containing protein [Lentisphaeria bacterium]